jgi:hypothetical protein
MPAVLASLTALTALTLSGNTLSGSVPASLLTQIAAATLVLYPQRAGAVLEAKTLSVSSLADITTVLNSVTPSNALVTTFVLQTHLSAAGQQGLTVPSTRKAPLVITGNTAACLSTAQDTPSPPPMPPPPLQPPGGGGGGPPGSPGNAAPSPTGRQSWQYVSLYTMCTVDMGGYGAVSAHLTVAGATTVVLRGVSLVGGGGSTGGAVFVNSSSAALILSGAQLSYNTARGNGGAVYSLASVTATDSALTSNAATAAGGAVFLADSAPTAGQPPSSAVLSLSNCSVTGNSAGVSHGGVVVIGGTNSLVASSSSFTLNTAAQDSGAVFVSGGIATLTSCLFDSNYVYDSSPQASSKAQMGGAVYARGGNATLAGCTLRNNSVGGFGGAVRADGVILVISNTAITTNSAGFNGGAIYATQSTSVFSNVRIADNTAQAGGGFGMSGGSVSMTNVVLSNNSVSSSSSQGGCIFADDDQGAYDAPAVLLANTTVTGCVVTTVRPVLDTPGQQYVAGYGAGSGGGVYMVGQRNTTGQLVLTSGTRFVGNNATSGAGIFVYGAVAVSISGSSFSANAATDMGGALYIQSAALTLMPSGRRRLLAPTLMALLASASITGSSFSGNSATNGGVAVLNSGSSLTASASAFTGNKATNGAVLMLRVLDQDGPAPVVSLSGITATANSAFSGALAYHDSDAALTLPTCAGCVLNNTQTNAGAAPTTFNASLTVLVAPSGRTLPTFSVTVYDINGGPVASWPDLVITVSPGDFTGLSGTVTAAYIAGAATFDALSISDVENANHTLTYTLSTTLATLNGATGSVVAVVAPCEANQVFDDSTLRCKCSAGTYLVGTSCTACPRGLVATAAGATECAVCLAREAWVNASACAACPANSVTSPYDATVCACDYGYYDTLYGASATEPACKACPVGGSCTSGFVAAAEGWWRESLLSDVLYVCRTGNCLQESVIGPLSKPDASNARAWVQLSGNLTAFNASAAVVGADGDTAPQNCVEGNAGPLCALCLPGYAMQSGACAVCDPKDAFDNWPDGDKTGLLVGCIVFALIFIAFAFFQPLVPALEVAADAIMERITAVPGKLKACITCACCACCRPKATPPAPKVAEDSGDAPLPPLAQGDGEAKPQARSSEKVDTDTHAVGAKPAAVSAAAQAEPQAAGTSTGGHHASHPHHHFEERQVYGVVHADATVAGQVQTNAAFAMGSMAAFTGDDGGGDDDGGGGINISGVEGQLDFMDVLEEMIEKCVTASWLLRPAYAY